MRPRTMRRLSVGRIVLGVSGPDQVAVQATFCATLVDQWIRDGVRHAVVAPGSRSTPMALALAARDELTVHVLHDERSAAFVALGIGRIDGAPAVLLCTSGTAATHFHGAVVEAHLSGVPMLVLTADRPPELRDVGAPQTIDQTQLYGVAVRWFHDPGVPASVAAGSWSALARQAIVASLGAHPGPVHLNLPFREPLVGVPSPLPEARLGAFERGAPSVSSASVASVVRVLDAPRGVIVAGAGIDDPDAVARLAEVLAWPVLADPRSGLRGRAGVVCASDGLLRDAGFAAAHRPDVVLHLGEPPASKVVGQWLAALDAPQVLAVDRPVVIDPWARVTHRLVGSIGAVATDLRAVIDRRPAGTWLDSWLSADRAAEATIDAVLGGCSELTEPAAARALSRFDGVVVVASSMPVRDVEWFGHPDQRAQVVANRGANGIDGTIATAIGVAAASSRPTAVLLGDIALVHDSSSLAALAGRGLDVRIVVLDNDGGGIFSFLPQAAELPGNRFEQLFGTPHGTDVVTLAAAHGLPSATVTTVTELEQWLDRPGPWLVRVPTERNANVELHRRLNEAVVSGVESSLFENRTGFSVTSTTEGSLG